MPEALRDVAVLAGGASDEHDVSCASAREVAAHLDPARWRAWAVLIDRDGAWHLPDAPTIEFGPRSAMRPGHALSTLLERGVSLVFPALHGRHGEDGTLQGMLELHGARFVGCGTAASAVAMDKLRTRDALTCRGVTMARAHRIEPGDTVDAAVEAVVAELGLPCFLKRDLSGSSYGVVRAETRDAVDAFLRECAGHHVVAEEQLEGLEISVPVLGNMPGPLRALPPIGIYPRAADWFDTTAKYDAGGAEEIAPAPDLDASMTTRVQELALLCHRVLRCDGVSRTDMILRDGIPHVLEVNTLPGMTQASLLPKCAAAAGLSFSALLTELLELADRCQR